MKYLTLILVFFSLTILAQEENTSTLHTRKYKHSFGVGVGFTTGYGLSYRYFPKRLGVQVNFAPYYNDYGNEAVVSTGLTFLYNLVDAEYTCLFLYFGNHYFLSRTKVYTSNYVLDQNNNWVWQGNTKIEERNILNNGIGLGFEFNTQKRVTFNVMGGYANYNTFERLFFTGELALYYRFN